MPPKLTLVSLALLLSLSSNAKPVINQLEDSTYNSQAPDTLKGKLVCTLPIKYFPEAFDIKNDTLYFIKHNSKKIQRYTLNGGQLKSFKRKGKDRLCFLYSMDDSTFLYGMFGVFCQVDEHNLFRKPLHNFFIQTSSDGEVIFKVNDTFNFLSAVPKGQNFLYQDYGYRIFDKNKTMNGNIDLQRYFYDLRTKVAMQGINDTLVLTNGYQFARYETNGRLINEFRLNEGFNYNIDIRANQNRIEMIGLDTLNQSYLSKYYLIDPKNGNILKQKILTINGIKFTIESRQDTPHQFAAWRKNQKLYLLLYQKSKTLQVYEFDTEK